MLKCRHCGRFLKYKERHIYDAYHIFGIEHGYYDLYHCSTCDVYFIKGKDDILKEVGKWINNPHSLSW